MLMVLPLENTFSVSEPMELVHDPMQLGTLLCYVSGDA